MTADEQMKLMQPEGTHPGIFMYLRTYGKTLAVRSEAFDRLGVSLARRTAC